MKKLKQIMFNWTPADIQSWEKIRSKGFWHFVLLYGVLAFGLILFVVTGGVSFLIWALTPVSLASLLFQLIFTLAVCLLGGLITGITTWWLEDGIYRKMTR